MILPTMTPLEKWQQMKKLEPYVRDLAERMIDRYKHKLWTCSRYPTFFVDEEREIKGMGKWRIVLVAESKSNIRKGIVCFKAYQTFHVTHAKDQINNGVGIYEFNADDYGNIQCIEVPPHYFNRLRERLIEPMGVVQPDFHKLVLKFISLTSGSMDLVLRGYTFKPCGDGMYDMQRDYDMDRKEGFENLISYCKHGVTLGLSTLNKGYYNLTTFVPNSMLREGQKESQRKAMQQIKELEFKQRYDPLCTINTKEWIDKGKDV